MFSALSMAVKPDSEEMQDQNHPNESNNADEDVPARRSRPSIPCWAPARCRLRFRPDSVRRHPPRLAAEACCGPQQPEERGRAIANELQTELPKRGGGEIH